MKGQTGAAVIGAAIVCSCRDFRICVACVRLHRLLTRLRWHQRKGAASLTLAYTPVQAPLNVTTSALQSLTTSTRGKEKHAVHGD